MGKRIHRYPSPTEDVINLLLEAATTPSWHQRQGGWAVWSFEFLTPVYEFMMSLNRLWLMAPSLNAKLQAIKPLVPYDVYKRAVVYAKLRWAVYLPPLQFRENLVVETKDGEATVFLPEPTCLSLIVPAPLKPARLLHLFLNYPSGQGQPVRVLSVWYPFQGTIHDRLRELSYALPKGKPSRIIRSITTAILNTHPEDLGVIGPWSPELAAAYLLLISELTLGMDPDALLATVQSISGCDKS